MDKVEIVYIPSNHPAICLEIAWHDKMTVEDALDESGMRAQYPEIEKMSLGVFAKAVTLHTHLNAGDRIEIYHPLLCDPKEIRRVRARKNRHTR